MERLPMHRVRKILRLRWVLGLGVRQAAASAGIGRSAVSKTTLRAEAAGLSWSTVEGLSDQSLEDLLCGPPRPPSKGRAEPDLLYVHTELRRPGVRLELLHLEYLREHRRAAGTPRTATLPRLAEAAWSVDAASAPRRRKGVRGLLGLASQLHRPFGVGAVQGAAVTLGTSAVIGYGAGAAAVGLQALGVVAAATTAAPVIAGVATAALLGWGISALVNSGAQQIVNSVGRVATGQGNSGDWYVVGNLFGGGAAGLRAGAVARAGMEAAAADLASAEAVGIVPGAAKGGGPVEDVVYHYTTEKAAASIQRNGLWSQSSATDVGTYTAQEATELLGVKGTSEVVLTIMNEGRFVPNKPATVQPHPLGPGGGLDMTNPVRVGPECIVCVRPVGQ